MLQLQFFLQFKLNKVQQRVKRHPLVTELNDLGSGASYSGV
jgi:hypothetical protein